MRQQMPIQIDHIGATRFANRESGKYVVDESHADFGSQSLAALMAADGDRHVRLGLITDKFGP